MIALLLMCFIRQNSFLPYCYYRGKCHEYASATGKFHKLAEPRISEILVI